LVEALSNASGLRTISRAENLTDGEELEDGLDKDIMEVGTSIRQDSRRGAIFQKDTVDEDMGNRGSICALEGESTDITGCIVIHHQDIFVTIRGSRQRTQEVDGNRIKGTVGTSNAFETRGGSFTVALAASTSKARADPGVNISAHSRPEIVATKTVKSTSKPSMTRENILVMGG